MYEKFNTSPSPAEVKNGGAIISTPPCFLAQCLINLAQRKLYLKKVPL
jgi:hypothetical protein